MGVWIGLGKQQVLSLDVHMDNAIPSALKGMNLVGPIAAIEEGIRHGVEDVPEKGFGQDKAVYRFLVNNES